MEPLTVTINDAKRAIGVGQTTIYKLINAGKLDVVKVGKRTLVRIDSIRRLVEISEAA